MKGVIFNLFEEAISKTYGEEMWDDLLDEERLDGAFTSLGNYPDASLERLVESASKRLNESSQEVIRWFGEQAIHSLAVRYPEFFRRAQNAREFLLSVNGIIHPEVRKVYPDADVPTFDFQDAPDGGVLMGYRSKRRLCALAQGFIEGSAKEFGETAQVEHFKCMLRGDEQCLCHVKFSKAVGTS